MRPTEGSSNGIASVFPMIYCFIFKLYYEIFEQKIELLAPLGRMNCRWSNHIVAIQLWNASTNDQLKICSKFQLDLQNQTKN